MVWKKREGDCKTLSRESNVKKPGLSAENYVKEEGGKRKSLREKGKCLYWKSGSRPRWGWKFLLYRGVRGSLRVVPRLFSSVVQTN
jgi:hypothetical protein